LATTRSLIQQARDYTNFVSRGDQNGVFSILEPEPVFDLFPIARRFSGLLKTRRYFQYFFSEVQPRIQGFISRSELISEVGVGHEYDITIALPNSSAPSSHRVFALIVFGPNRLLGERIYSDEKMLRMLIGPLWNSLEPIPAD
jgi:hypothetical protein